MTDSPGGGQELRRAVQQGAALLDLGRAGEALVHLRNAVAQDPQDARIHGLIAVAYLRLDRPAEALASADAGAALDPQDAWPHRLRSLALTKLDRKGEAKAAALEACRLEPGEAMAHVVLSGALLASGDQAGALAAARHAVELAPSSADTHNQVGLVLLDHERNADAEQAFRGALALDAEHAQALNNLAVAQLRRGRRGAALDGLEQAARLDPGSATVRRNVLRVGGARWPRRLELLFLAFAVIGFAATGDPSTLLVWLALAGVCELARWVVLRRLAPPTRNLVNDDARARRFRPRRWDWAWVTRLRPWWWILLSRIPAPAALALNIGLLGLAVVGGNAVWMVVTTVALPFSVLRAGRWWRRGHPGAESWRPQDPG